MAKYACPCCRRGYAHTSGEIPNPNEYLVTSAHAWNAMPDAGLAADELYARATFLYRCVACDAIAIFWQGLDAQPTWYCVNADG